ncbi:MAG: hypothetical protein ACOYOS_19905 [Syntrophales bacterium]
MKISFLMKIIDSYLSKHISFLAMGAFLVVISSDVCAAVIDPEKHIQKNGYHSMRTGDDGITKIYSFTERTNSSLTSALGADIAALPKDAKALNACDFMRGGVKANLIEQRGIAIDVAVTNYGYSGSTIACLLKYMHENKVGTQLIFVKTGPGGLYMVFVVD